MLSSKLKALRVTLVKPVAYLRDSVNALAEGKTERRKRCAGFRILYFDGFYLTLVALFAAFSKPPQLSLFALPRPRL